MIETEILVVGGGPAGSTIAGALTRAGLNTLVLDKERFPRPKVCAGWITPAVLRELDIRPEDYSKNHVLQPIHAFRTSQIGGQAVETGFSGEPVSYGIRRVEFDHYLLQRCGARLMTGQPFRSMNRQSDYWIVNDAIKARMVVGAGGHFCPVARLSGAIKRPETAVLAQEIEFKMTPEQKSQCPVNEEMPELYFTRDLKGYGWVFRKNDYLNIGFGREDRRRLKGHVDHFRHYLERKGSIPSTLPEKFSGHAYLLYPHAKRTLFQNGVLLIGDAAGLAYAQSGEGIRPAVESALLAASVLLDCKGDYSGKRLNEYAVQLERRFGRRLPGPGLRDRIPPTLTQFLARRLMKNAFLTRKLLIRRWFLREQDKALAAM